jgi:hypothetical protein
MFNVGDTFFAQPFVKNIIDNNGDQFEYYIVSKFNYFIYQSIIPDINIIVNHDDFLHENNINLSRDDLNSYDYYFSNEQKILFINTWIGNYIYTHCHRKEYFLTYYKESMVECDQLSYIKSYQTMLNLILNKENIKINYNNDPLLAVPTFPPNLDINKFLNFKKNNTGKKIVFFNNYYPGSGQILSIHSVDDRIRIIDFFIKKNYIVLLPEYEHYLQVYKEKNNVIDLYFAPVIFDMVINTSAYDVYLYAKIAHNCDLALYFDSGRNFIYINQEFIDEYKNNINRNTKIHFAQTDIYFKPISNPVYFPEGYVNYIQASNCDEIIKKLENSNYV